MTVQERAGSVTLGPVLFNWQPEKWRDFYFRIADEAPVSTVYLGETVCSKRAPLIEPYYAEVAERLQAAGKTVVFSSLSEVLSKLDRKLAEQICTADGFLVEANDGSALLHLKGRPHHIGPLMNVYNERTVAFLAGNGAQNVCLPVEMPATAVAALCQATRDLDVSIEVQVFGRQSLALSARCYHARAHGRTKDSCRFVCEEDPDGLELTHARRPQVPHRQRHPDAVLRISQSAARSTGAARHGRLALPAVAAYARHGRGRQDFRRRCRRQAWTSRKPRPGSMRSSRRRRSPTAFITANPVTPGTARAPSERAVGRAQTGIQAFS